MGFFKKLIKKVTRPISKVLDKVVPNEIKPLLPYAAAFAPMLLPAGGGIMSSMLGRGLMSGGANLAAQLSQEGSEGDFNALSTLLAGGLGSLTAPGAKDTLQGMKYGDAAGMIEINPNAPAVPYEFLDTTGNTTLQNLANKGIDFASKGADLFTSAGDKFAAGDYLNKDVLKAAAIGGSQGAMDNAYATAMRAEKDFLNSGGGGGGGEEGDQNRGLAVRRAMERGGHTEQTIQDMLLSLGYEDLDPQPLAYGGRVNAMGGGIMSNQRGLVNQPGGYAGITDILNENMIIREPYRGDPGYLEESVDMERFNKEPNYIEEEQIEETEDGKFIIKPRDVPRYETMPLPRNYEPKYETMPLPRNYEPKYELFNQGGRVGFKGGGMDAGLMNISFPPMMGNPAVIEKIENMREFNITDPDIEDVTDYSIELKEKIKEPDFGGITEAVEKRPADNMLMQIAKEVGPLLLGVPGMAYLAGKAAYKMYQNLEQEDKNKVMDISEKIINVAQNTTVPGLAYKGGKMLAEKMTQNKKDGGMMSVLPKGMEMDYRGGGFIPMGSKERADDVPARVSKNEFVMTADAVKAAGGGSVNEGARRMYNLMNNLEARA